MSKMACEDAEEKQVSMQEWSTDNIRYRFNGAGF